MVFDCSAFYQGTSLKAQVYQWPDLTNKPLGVLLLSRQQPIALNADIEGMFLQVRVPPDQRDTLCFLWWDDNDLAKPPEHYQMTNHLFGGAWRPSAANFALRHVAKENQEPFSEDTVETVLKNFYVDDCLKSMPDNDSAIRLASALCTLLAQAGFNLTKWLSNSKGGDEGNSHGTVGEVTSWYQPRTR